MPVYPDPLETIDKLRERRRAMSTQEALEPVETGSITRGQLLDLDIVLCFIEATACLFSEDMADDIFNIRNHLVPYVEGEPWFDPEIEDESE